MQTRDEINCFYKTTFPGEKEKLLFRELIKREILTSLEVLCTKLVRVISLCFAKRCFPKYGFFSLKMSAQTFQPTRNWVDQVNLSSFSTQNLFQIHACVISARKAKHLNVTTMFTYSHANTPLGQSERAYYLSSFINIKC